MAEKPFNLIKNIEINNKFSSFLLHNEKKDDIIRVQKII